MKSPLRFLAALAVAVSLPVVLSAQSTAGSSTGSAMGNSAAGTAGTPTRVNPPSPGNTSQATPGTAVNHPPGPDAATTADDSSTTLGIQAITQKALNQQLTAKSLTGKEVFDNQGKPIGKVKDVVLDFASAPQLAGAFAKRNGTNGHGDDGRNPNAGSDMPSASGGAGVDAAGNPAMASETESTRAGIAATLYGAAAVIVPTGPLAKGKKLITVPLAQLNYDSRKHHLTLNLSRKDLALLTHQDTARNAAE